MGLEGSCDKLDKILDKGTLGTGGWVGILVAMMILSVIGTLVFVWCRQQQRAVGPTSKV